MKFSIPKAFILITLSITLFAACKQSGKKQDTKEPLSTKRKYELIYKHAGEYAVTTLPGTPKDTEEMYVFVQDGSAKWMRLKNDGDGGAHVEAQKAGTWEATENSIRVIWEENPDVPTEEFELKNNRFTDTKNGTRYLSKY